MAALQEKETQTQLELAAQEDALRQLRQRRDALRHEVEKSQRWKTSWQNWARRAVQCKSSAS